MRSRLAWTYFAAAAKVVTVALVPLMACRGSTPRDYGSSSDVDAILKSGGVTGAKLICANPSYDGAVTRGFTCMTTLSTSDITTLTAKLGLSTSAPMLNGGNRDTCEVAPNVQSSNPNVDVLMGMNKSIPNGVGRFEIHVNRSTRAACVQIEYPSG